MNEESISKLTDSFFARMRLPDEMRSDPEERELMKGYILEGRKKLDLIACGKSVDYEKDEYAGGLLYNYCFYARNDCCEKFSSAYRSDLIALRNMAVAGKLEHEAEKGSEDAAQDQ